MNTTETIDAASLEDDFAADIAALALEAGDADSERTTAGYHHGDRWIATRDIEVGGGNAVLTGAVRYPAELADWYGDTVEDAVRVVLHNGPPPALQAWVRKAFGSECHRDDETNYVYRVTASETRRAGVYAVRVACEVEAVRGRDRD